MFNTEKNVQKYITQQARKFCLKYHMLTHIYEIQKNGTDEPTGRAGLKTQMQRTDLRTPGGGRVSWDEVREWHGHIYTTKRKIDSQWEAATQHREISLVLCDHLEGWDKEGGREMQEGGDMGIYVYIQLIQIGRAHV